MSIQRAAGQKPHGRQVKVGPKPAPKPAGEAPRGAAPPRLRSPPPVLNLDDLDEVVSPPRHGKTHPPGDMDDATPTLDDEVRSYHHHPSDSGTTAFGFDPEAADAAADLAGDLGSAFLEGATRGEDMSDLAAQRSDLDEEELPLLLDEEGEEAVEEEDPAARAVRARPFEEPGALGQSTVREALPADRIVTRRKKK